MSKGRKWKAMHGKKMFPEEWDAKYKIIGANFPLKDLERLTGVWDEKSQSYIKPAGTVKQGRRPMFRAEGA